MENIKQYFKFLFSIHTPKKGKRKIDGNCITLKKTLVTRTEPVFFSKNKGIHILYIPDPNKLINLAPIKLISFSFFSTEIPLTDIRTTKNKQIYLFLSFLNL